MLGYYIYLFNVGIFNEGIKCSRYYLYLDTKLAVTVKPGVEGKPD
jgi:hypothetical protein